MALPMQTDFDLPLLCFPNRVCLLHLQEEFLLHYSFPTQWPPFSPEMTGFIGALKDPN